MKRFFLLLSFLVLLIPACRVFESLPEKNGAIRYAGVFGNDIMQQQYEVFTASVVRLTVFVSYQTQVFEPDSRITLPVLASGADLSATRARLIHNESFSGTATVVAVNGNKALLLACAHNVNFPDTLFSYDDRADLLGNRYLLGLSVKTGEVIQVSCPSGVLQASITGMNAGYDLAFLEISADAGIELPPPAGQKLVAKEDLHWGDFLWLTGYPSGRFMMTTGIISNPGSKEGFLLTDAPFSDGYSGAPALVYDQVAGEFKLAGIGRSVAAHSGYVLKPEKKIHEAAYNTALPYTGQVYVDIEKQPASGVTFIVSPELLKAFYLENTKNLKLAGWNSELFVSGVQEVK